MSTDITTMGWDSNGQGQRGSKEHAEAAAGTDGSVLPEVSPVAGGMGEEPVRFLTGEEPVRFVVVKRRPGIIITNDAWIANLTGRSWADDRGTACDCGGESPT